MKPVAVTTTSAGTARPLASSAYGLPSLATKAAISVSRSTVMSPASTPSKKPSVASETVERAMSVNWPFGSSPSFFSLSWLEVTDSTLPTIEPAIFEPPACRSFSGPRTVW